MNIFRARHPFILILYISVVLTLLTTLQPFVILLAFVGAVIYLTLVQSIMYMLRELAYYSAVTLLITVMYASFAHNGVTPLFFLNDHPITLEAIIRGAMLGATVTTAALWLQAYSITMQTNHFLFLFTKMHPRLGIFASMCFRFFPYYSELWQENKRAQQGMHYFQTASRFERLGRWLVLQLHTLVQAGEAVFWKPAVMTSKGYQRKRTQYELFKWQKLDTILGIFIVASIISSAVVLEDWQYEYFPQLATLQLSFVHGWLCVLFLLPAIIEGKELLKWHYLQSKI